MRLAVVAQKGANELETKYQMHPMSRPNQPPNPLIFFLLRYKTTISDKAIIMIKDRVSKPLKMSSRLLYDKMLRVRALPSLPLALPSPCPPFPLPSLPHALRQPLLHKCVVINVTAPSGARAQQIPRRRRRHPVQHCAAVRPPGWAALCAARRPESLRGFVRGPCVSLLPVPLRPDSFSRGRVGAASRCEVTWQRAGAASHASLADTLSSKRPVTRRPRYSPLTRIIAGLRFMIFILNGRCDASFTSTRKTGKATRWDR
jgi:hypothetical protein